MHLLFYGEAGAEGRVGRGFARGLALLLFLALVATLIARSVFFVDESEYVYVTQFGQPLQFYSEPGLQVKWPYQTLRRFDRRLQVFEPPAREMLTQDKENLTFAWYVCWRLPGQEFMQQSRGSADNLEQAVSRFLQSVGTVEMLENRLEERVQAAMSAEIGRLRFEQLVSLDEQQLQLDELAEKISLDLRSAAIDQFGVEVVDVRLKRITYPEAVKPAVFAEIRSERERVAVQYRAEGASEKAKIQSQADLQREQILSRARRESLAIRGSGDAKAIEISNEAHSKDPQFYELLKTLETYRSVLDNQTTVVLSAESPLLRLLTKGVPEPTPSRVTIPLAPTSPTNPTTPANPLGPIGGTTPPRTDQVTDKTTDKKTDKSTDTPAASSVVPPASTENSP